MPFPTGILVIHVSRALDMSRTRGEVAGSAVMGPQRKLVFPLGVALGCTEPNSLCVFVTVYCLLFLQRGERKGTGNQKNIHSTEQPVV